MASEMTEPEVRHEADRQRFVIEIGDAVALLTYAVVDEATLNYNHSFVPPALRGRGLAGVLTRHALGYAAAQGLKVVPSCPYVGRYIEKHPEYAHLLRHSGAPDA